MTAIAHLGEVGSGSASADTLTLTLTADISQGTASNPSGLVIPIMSKETWSSPTDRANNWLPTFSGGFALADFYPTITDSVGTVGPPWFRRNVHMGPIFVNEALAFGGIPQAIYTGTQDTLTLRGVFYFNVLNDLSSGDTITIDFSAGVKNPVWLGGKLHHFTGIDSHFDASGFYTASPLDGGYDAFRSGQTDGVSTFSPHLTYPVFTTWSGTAMIIAGNHADTANITFAAPGFGPISEQYSIIKSGEGHIGYVIHTYSSPATSGDFDINAVSYYISSIGGLKTGANLPLPGSQFYETFRAHQ